MAEQKEYPKADGDVYYGDDANKMFGVYVGTEAELLSVTSSSGSVVYSGSYQYHVLRNTGGNKCFINFGSAATTNNFDLDVNEEISVWGVTQSISAITASSTTTLRIRGFGSTSQAPSITVNNLSVTTTSGSVLLSDSNGVFLKNTGTNNIYFNFGSNASTNDTLLTPNEKAWFFIRNPASVHAITSSSTSTLKMISFGAF